MEGLTGAEVIVEFLIKAKIPYFIGYPGHTVTEILDIVYDKSKDSELETILVRHEATAAFMADGYFRVKHKPLAIWTHTGPGATNAITGVATAFLDSSAMLVFTGEPWSLYHGRGAYQEIYRNVDAELPSLFRPITKRVWQVKGSDVKRLPEVLIRGYKLAITGRPGPVLFDVTQEALVERAQVSVPSNLGSYIPSSRIGSDKDTISRAVEILIKAERPIILAGGGALISEAWEEIEGLSNILQAPVVTTIMGKSCFNEEKELSLGIIGTWGTMPANKATREADVILAIGTRFSETDSSSWLNGYTFSIPPTKLIQIDIDPYEIGKYYPVELGIIGDAKTVLKQIIERISEITQKARVKHEWLNNLLLAKKQWTEMVEEYSKREGDGVNPLSLIRKMMELLPSDGIVVTDVGNHQKWVAQQFLAKRPLSTITTMGFASMGFGPSASLGVKLAKRESPVVCVTGDGGFVMSSNVLATSFEYQLPVIYVIFNDFRLGSIYSLQKNFYKGRIIASEFKTKRGEPYNPDFTLLAKSYKCEGREIRNLEEFSKAFKEAISSDISYVLDVRIDKDARLLPGGGTWILPSRE